MTIDDQTREVQRHYPRIYIACHVDHRARRGQGEEISARDQTILAHVPESGTRANELAAHLDIAVSTMSEALKRLSALELITTEPAPDDARARIVRLTLAGRAALSKTSVLDQDRIYAALSRLSEDERSIVIRGLALLADAAHAAKSAT